MSDPHLFTSLLKRQRKKLIRARELVPWFTECGKSMLVNASLRDIAEFLEASGAKPTSEGRGKWTANTVNEFLRMDGDDPDDRFLTLPNRSEGMRIKIWRAFDNAKHALDFQQPVGYGKGASDRFEAELESHCRDITVTAQSIRKALRRD